MAARKKIQSDQEAAFAAAWRDPHVTVEAIERRFGLRPRSGYTVARRLQLPHRMPMLQSLGLPPFGPRRGECAA